MPLVRLTDPQIRVLLEACNAYTADLADQSDAYTTTTIATLTRAEEALRQARRPANR